MLALMVIFSPAAYPPVFPRFWLKDLEAELGKKLFVRSSFSVRLTDEGMLLRKRAEDILEMVDKAAAEFKALDEVTGGDIHIGCAESDGIKHLARWIKSVQA